MAREAIPGISAGCVLQRLYKLARANYRLFRLYLKMCRYAAGRHFRRSNSSSLAKLAAMRRVLAVHIYDRQNLEARPQISTKALRSCTTAAYALRHRAARTVAKFRPPEARR